MISPAQPTKDELDLLKQHWLKSKSSFTRLRAHAVLLSSKNYSPYQISNILFKTEKTVREWIKAFHKKRISSIFSRHCFNQNAAKLTKEQKQQITKILQLPPCSYGLPKTFWEVKSLKRFIKTEFDVEYQSPQSYYLIFRISSFSYHVPNTVSIRKDDKKIKIRMAQIKNELRQYINNDKWVVLCADETRLLWQTLVRKAWFPKGREGKKTIIRIENIDEYQNFFGALNLKTGKPHLIKLKWQKQENIITALKYLKRSYPNKRICLLWDNASFHKGKLVREELSKSLSIYHLINFPSYAPEKNPQEKIWRYAKDKISNHQTSSFIQTIANFRRIVMGRNYHYQI